MGKSLGKHHHDAFDVRPDAAQEEEAAEEEDKEDEAGDDEHTRKQPSKAAVARRPFPLCCLFAQRTVAPSDDHTEDASEEDGNDATSGAELDSTERPDRRVFLTIVASEHVQVRDFLAGSNPYVVVKPDGRGGARPTQRTTAEWLAPNATFGETFEFDVCASDLPVRLVIWDRLEELATAKELKRAAKALAAAGRPEVPPAEAYMRYVDLPDLDHPPGHEVDPKRKRALPRFVEIPEARRGRAAWFPVQEPPLTKVGDGAFDDANKHATGIRQATHTAQMIDPNRRCSLYILCMYFYSRPFVCCACVLCFLCAWPSADACSLQAGTRRRRGWS